MTLGANGALNGFIPAATDAWHQDISGAPIDPNSAKIINTNGDLGGAHLFPNFSIPLRSRGLVADGAGAGAGHEISRGE